MSDERNKHGLSLERTVRPQTEAQKQSVEKSATARYQAEHQVDAREPQGLAQLSARVADGQQRATLRYENAQQELENRQNVQRQELENRHEAKGPDVGQSREADRKAEVDTLQRFQEIQRQQLTQHQQLEQKALQGLSEMVADLQARQHQEQTKSVPALQAQQQPDALRQRQQFEPRQQRERELLVAYVAQQMQTLKDYRSEQLVQTSQDGKAFQEALYRAGHDADRQDSLRDMLGKQQEAQKELERVTEERLFSSFAQRAFSERISDTRAIRAIWEEVTRNLSNSATAFDKARGDFWKAVNKATDDNARTIKRILETAGYELQQGSNAPLLKLAGWNHGWDHARPSRELVERRLDLDHVAAQSVRPGERMKSENLRFMPGWDNSSRGNRYNENDFKRQPTEAERKVERDALTSREQAQRQQVLEHLQLEQKVLRELRDAIADLQAQQRLEQDELEAGFQAHLQELQDHQDKMRA